jgi:hypothetical protein
MSERESSKAIAVREGLPMDETGIQLRTLEDAYRFAESVVASGLAPSTMNTPAKVLVALQIGMEVGLSPMTAVRSVYVINGMPTFKGEIALALVRRSGRMQNDSDGIDGIGDNRVAWIRSQRGDRVYETRFSVADAKLAGLWDKPGPWKQWPNRMLLWRARGFHMKDYYSDVLLGIPITEEARDYPEPLQLVEKLPPPAPGPDPLLAQVVEAEVLRPGVAEEPPEDWTPTEVADAEDAQA